MKKNIIITALMLGTAFAGFSQKKFVTSAISLAKKGKFIKAKTYIDQAIEHEKTKDDAKTWYWKAAINAGIADMKTPEAKEIQESTDLTAVVMESMKKTKELDKDGDFNRELRSIAGPMYGNTYNKGIEAYQSKDYKKSLEYFTTSQEYATIIGIVDTNGAFNAGMSAVQVEDYAAAVKNYKMCIGYEYGGSDVYLKLADTYSKMGDKEKAAATLAEAKNKFKNDPKIVLNEAQIYADNKEYDKAKASLESAVKSDPENFQLQLASAIIYSNMELYDESISSYKKAIAINPKMEDLKSDMIIMQYNKIVLMNEAMNKFDLSETAKYNKAKADRDAYIKEVLPTVEARYKDDSSESLKRILNNLYGLTGQAAKRIK